jgi:hypothetical protein
MQAGSPAFDQPGPARQIARLWRVRDSVGLIQRFRKALADLALRDARTQEIGPQEFAERRRVLGEATAAPHAIHRRFNSAYESKIRNNVISCFDNGRPAQGNG